MIIIKCHFNLVSTLLNRFSDLSDLNFFFCVDIG